MLGDVSKLQQKKKKKFTNDIVLSSFPSVICVCVCVSLPLLIKNQELETVLFKVLLIHDFDILGLVGLERAQCLLQAGVPVCISVLQRKQTLR